jgi:hypothetical protein
LLTHRIHHPLIPIPMPNSTVTITTYGNDFFVLDGKIPLLKTLLQQKYALK